VQEKLSSVYPLSWITEVTEDERRAALKAQPGKPRPELAPVPEKAPPPKVSGPRQGLYVVNLLSSRTPDIRPKRPLPNSLRNYRLYTTTSREGGKVRYRLLLGFFANVQEAKEVRDLLKKRYPNARIDRISRAEKEASAKTAIVFGGSKLVPQKPAAESKIPTDPNAQAGLLLSEGRKALTSGDNSKAIRLFTQVLHLPQNPYTQEARELLGLARERNGQINLAKVEYKLYLKLYPTGEDADRVRQRLLNLTGEGKAAVKLKTPNKKQKGQFQAFGTLAQTYFRGNSKVEIEDTTPNPVPQPTLSDVDQDALLTTLDITARYRGNRYDNRFVFSGSGTNDFLEDSNTSEVSNAYFELRRKAPHEVAARLGRQPGNAYGISGRFDGALIDYNLLPKWRLNFVSGVPVDDIAPESDRYFYGVSTDLGPFGRTWTGNLYYIQDRIDGITDREAVGAEMRYFSPKGSFFSLVDYDILFDQLNIAFLQGNWQVGKATSINFLADYRKFPPLHLTNAMQGSTAQSINELLNSFTEEELQLLALGLTGTAKVASIGATGPISKKFQWNINITNTELSGTDGGNGIPPTEGTGNITSYTAQVIGNSLLLKNDITVTGVSYITARDFDATSLSFVTRLPFKRRWRLELSAKVFRQDNITGTTLTRFLPAIELDYRSKKNVTFELNFGREISNVDSATSETQTVRDFVSVGYRWDF
jgi:tetratricopeptide (TPR) repeat protein